MFARLFLVPLSSLPIILALGCSDTSMTSSDGGALSPTTGGGNPIDGGADDTPDGSDTGGNDNDAGATSDAGGTGDAGGPSDAGSTGDAGGPSDAGSTGDAGGPSDAGSTGDAGGPSDGGPGSNGCGKAPPPQTNDRQTIDVAGTARQYIVNYPEPYDPNRRYRVLYVHHGRGGNADQNITRNGGWYGVGPLSENSVIFVSPHGDGDGTTTGWPNSGGRDVAFLRTLVAHINATYCVDESRIFSTGMSYGGNFSNRLGCEMGDVFRAIVPFAGWGPVGGPSGGGGGGGGNCVGQVAALVSHGTTDSTVDFTAGQASRDHWLAANHCKTTTVATDPSGCVLYEGCDTGYPVGWCEHTGGHILPMFSGPAIWNFISRF